MKLKQFIKDYFNKKPIKILGIFTLLLVLIPIICSVIDLIQAKQLFNLINIQFKGFQYTYDLLLATCDNSYQIRHLLWRNNKSLALYDDKFTA